METNPNGIVYDFNLSFSSNAFCHSRCLSGYADLHKLTSVQCNSTKWESL